MDVFPKTFESWIYLIVACVIGIFIGQWMRNRRKDESRSQPNPYDIEYEIADLIDKTPLEMLTNKETRIILFKSDIVDALRVCLSSTKKFSPGEELAEVFINTLEGYEKLIDLRRQKMPSTIYADFLAMEAAKTLLKQAGLFQGTLRERRQ
jgi:hypothetical protein